MAQIHADFNDLQWTTGSACRLVSSLQQKKRRCEEVQQQISEHLDLIKKATWTDETTLLIHHQQRHQLIQGAFDLLHGIGLSGADEAVRIPMPANILKRDVLLSFVQKLTASGSSMKSLTVVEQMLWSLRSSIANGLYEEVQIQLEKAQNLVSYFADHADHEVLFDQFWQAN